MVILLFCSTTLTLAETSGWRSTVAIADSPTSSIDSIDTLAGAIVTPATRLSCPHFKNSN